MTSTLKLYYSTTLAPWELIPSKLFKVDNIADYLATKSFIQIDDFQYIKHGLEIEIKIDKTQSFSQPLTGTGFKYVSIQNGTEEVCYYFVKRASWRSQNSVRLELVMDVLNSLVEDTHYKFKNNTRIIREHKDRLSRGPMRIQIAIGDTEGGAGSIIAGDTITLRIDLQGWELVCTGKVVYSSEENLTFIVTSSEDPQVIRDTIDDGVYFHELFQVSKDGANYFEARFDSANYSYDYTRKIDLYSEGLTPILYGEDQGEISEDGSSWYLIYKDASLRCYLTSDNGFNVKIAGTTEISANDLVEGNYYYIMGERNPNRRVDMTTNENFVVTAYISKNVFQVDSHQWVTLLYKDGANIKVERLYYYNVFGWHYDYKVEYTTSKVKILSNYDVVKANILTTRSTSLDVIRNGTNHDFNMTTTTKEVWPFSSLNRRDSTLVKIIKVPYRPTDSTFTGWKYDDASHMIYLDLLDTSLENSLQVNFNPLSSLHLLGGVPNIDTLRNDIYESKLYHSDYYQPKFVYDSFSFIFALERVNMNNYVESSTFNVVFRASNAINSRFLFSFPDYRIEGKLLEDYSNILIVARNNDVPYYTDSYMQYVKTGFNFDVKTKERQEAGTWIGTALSLVGSVASFASSGVTGGFGIVGGITLATSAVGQLVNAVNTTAQAEANQAQKLLQLKHQQSSVASADDVDLMTAYTNNKAKWMLYQASERMRGLLSSLFFFAGYTSDRMGLPNHNTRVNFDYLEAEVSLETAGQNISEEIIDELKKCFKIGVTYIHKTTRTSDKWDMSQKYENWEKSIMED